MSERVLVLAAIGVAVLVGVFISFAIKTAHGQEAVRQSEPQIGVWYARQRIPDNQYASCCGEGDAYEADKVKIIGDQVWAEITDTRPDNIVLPNGQVIKRPHIPPGQMFLVPPSRVNDARKDPNPTGHGIIFIGNNGTVYCYFPPGGV